MRRLIWAAAARRDLAMLVAYIDEDDPEAADRVETAILEAVGRLLDFPFRGRPGRRTGTRELVVAAYRSYVIVYTVEQDRIGIVRVLHNRQAWPGPSPAP